MVDNYKYQFRIVVIGDTATGKTSLVNSLINNYYSPHTDTTVGVDFSVKIVELERGLKVQLQLWDTAAQERFRALVRSYYRDAMGVALVYDATNRQSFLHLVDWMHEADLNTNNAIFQVIACKCDRDLYETERAVSTEEGQEFAKFHKMKFIETSAKDLYNVKEAFIAIARTILKEHEYRTMQSYKHGNSKLLLSRSHNLSLPFQRKGCTVCQYS